MCLSFLFERSWFIPLMIWNHLGNIWQQKLWCLVKKMQLPGWAAFTGDTALTWGGTFSLKSLAAELVSGYRYILREGRSLSSHCLPLRCPPHSSGLVQIRDYLHGHGWTHWITNQRHERGKGTCKVAGVDDGGREVKEGRYASQQNVMCTLQYTYMQYKIVLGQI